MTEPSETEATHLHGAPMRAMVCERLEGLQGLVLGTRPKPVAGHGEVLIRVRAAGVNFPDVLMLCGGYQFKPTMPYIPGLEAAGEIVACGADVTGWTPGDRVMAGLSTGAFAEFVATKTYNLLRIPDGWSFAEGAAFRVGAMTAHAALDHGARLQTGETVLVHGASGGMGMAAVQLARTRGARVIATSASEAKLAQLKALGAADGVCVSAADWPKQVKALTDGRGADVVFDPVGGDVLLSSLSAAAPGGRLLVVGFTSGGPSLLPSNHILIKRLSVIGIRAGDMQRANPATQRAFDGELVKLMQHDGMRPHISVRVPLERAADALAALMERRVIGKAVVEIA